MGKNIKLIIPMSGIGKRFVEAGFSVPKPLIEVDGLPIIKHVVDLFHGVSDISFICNDVHLQTTEMRPILLSLFPTCKIFSIPIHSKGPVFAVNSILNKDEFQDDGKEIIVSYCDFGTKWNFNEFLLSVRKDDCSGAIPCYKGFHPHLLGSDNYAFCKESNGFLEQIQEKKSFTGKKMEEFASNGIYYFKNLNIVKKYFKELIDNDISTKGEYYVSMVYNLLVRDSLKVKIFEIEKMLQWGTPYDLAIYNSWSKYFSDLIKKKEEVVFNEEPILVLPMAGKGSRFAEKGYLLPKPLLDVNGKTMIEAAVKPLPPTKRKVFVCLSEHLSKFELSNKIHSSFANSEIVVLNEVSKGQACSCEVAIKESRIKDNESILISACDNAVVYSNSKYVELQNDENIDVIVWTFRNSQSSKINPEMYAWVSVDENFFVKNVSCKKFLGGNPLEQHVINGTFFFRKSKYFIDSLAENYKNQITTNNEYYVDDVINQCVASGLKVKVFEVDHYVCWGTPDDYKTYQYWLDFFSKNKQHPYFNFVNK